MPRSTGAPVFPSAHTALKGRPTSSVGDRSSARPGEQRKTVGILGGMGPAATVDFFRRVVAASRDQDHLHILIDCQPVLPDRTAFILGEGQGPTPMLVEMACRLQVAGADLLVIPCNTAGAFLERLRTNVRVPVVSWVDEAATELHRLHPGLKRIGLLATTGTVQARLYHEAFARHRVEVVTPAASEQDRLMEAIYGRLGLKAGSRALEEVAAAVTAVGDALLAEGAELILLACTELSLLTRLHELMLDRPVYDSEQLVAERVVELAGASVRAVALG